MENFEAARQYWLRMDSPQEERLSTPDADGVLVREVAKGSEEAIAILYERHGGLIYRFSLSLSRDSSVAEEITQEVFLALMKQSSRFDPSRAELSTWLCGIARKMIWKQFKRQKRWQPIEARGDEGETTTLEDDPGVTLSRNELVSLVRRKVDDLAPHFREVVILCELEEMTYESAAVVLGVPIGTVRSRLHRAKAQLARTLHAAHKILKEKQAR